MRRRLEPDVCPQIVRQFRRPRMSAGQEMAEKIRQCPAETRQLLASCTTCGGQNGQAICVFGKHDLLQIKC